MKRDFNTIKNDLINHLKLSFQHDDGTIYWYEGTLDVIQEFLNYVYFHYKEDEAWLNCREP